jgi:hypothetical protein
MAGVTVHGWWWQLFHDPTTPQFLVALGVLFILGGIALIVITFLDVRRVIHPVGCRYCRRVRPHDKP